MSQHLLHARPGPGWLVWLAKRDLQETKDLLGQAAPIPLGCLAKRPEQVVGHVLQGQRRHGNPRENRRLRGELALSRTMVFRSDAMSRVAEWVGRVAPVGDLSPSVQASLLRALQEREVRPVGSDRSERVDVRVIAATHRDLLAEVKANAFREDLYYRLNVVPIHVPPLRERRDDIVPIARAFAERASRRFGGGQVSLTPALEAHLRAMPWPGNVRELENTLERLVVISGGPVIDVDPLVFASPRADAAPSLKEQVERFERGLIAEAMSRAAGNQSEAARQLGASRATLIDKLEKYGLK